MPVEMERRRTETRAHSLHERRKQAAPGETGVSHLDIGLVNNMPDAALESTERQFVSLLDAASSHVIVRLRLISLPGVPRADLGCDYVRNVCWDMSELWGSRLDGLVVTGAEPRTVSLCDEPYWANMARLIDWAEENTSGSIWSCLAAHAAVLHRDGIVRRPLKGKRFGLFECVQMADHPLMDGVPARMRVAHSRWNELSLDVLSNAGYTVLTRSAEAGVDAFVKHGKSLAVFFQGHPEYDARALLREYRRDVGRFLRGEREVYPGMPRGYFDRLAAAELTAFRLRALCNRRETLLMEFPMAAAEVGLTPDCDSPAVGIYENWLRFLLKQKARRVGLPAASWPRGAASLTAPLAADGAR